MTSSRKVITVFTDGSCQGSNYDDRDVGIGVHFPDGEFSDVGIACTSAECKTNQAAELYAIQVALETIDQDPEYQSAIIMIKSDSMYSINCVTKWIQNWRRNGWKTSNGTDVLNREMIEAIDRVIGKRTVLFRHVSAHTGGLDPDSIGNAVADSLANQGARLAAIAKSGDCDREFALGRGHPPVSSSKMTYQQPITRSRRSASSRNRSDPVDVILLPEVVATPTKHKPARQRPARNSSRVDQKSGILTIQL